MAERFHLALVLIVSPYSALTLRLINRARRLRFFACSGEYNLTVSPVTLDDDGVYQCQVGVGKRDEPAIRSRKATLTVLVAPDRPRIVQGETMTAAENVPVELECVSDGGKPPAEVSAYQIVITYRLSRRPPL